jgi:hypothetical protein
LARPEKKRGEWGAFVGIVLMVSIMAVWALIPIKVMESSWATEQESMASWAGESTRRWIESQAGEMLSQLAEEGAKAVDGMGSSQVDGWLAGRLYVTLLWASLIVYRAYVLMMWALIGIPLVLAASVDGLYIREIRKHSFVSQSPIRHKIGIHFFHLVTIVMVVWLCLPIPAPFFVAPLVIAFMAFSLWLWAGNLQKRL